MRIITDTNIWYELARNPTLLEKVSRKNLFPSWVNLYEILKSENLIKDTEFIRKVVQIIYRFKNNFIFEPPFVHLLKLHLNQTLNQQQPLHEFMQRFADGMTLKPDHINFLNDRNAAIRNDFKTATDFFNHTAGRIRKSVNKKDHREIDTSEITLNFIKYIVKTTNGDISTLNSFDRNKIELLLKSLDHFFKTVELSKQKIKDNDWFDFSILAYVQPNYLYWTIDGPWKRIITEAGCNNYLFDPSLNN